jgi:cell wall-associated NlpC family hydrolase
MWLQSSRNRILVGIVVLLLLGFVVSCGVGGLATTSAPRWACPSPTPKPWGAAGPVKLQIALPTAIPVGSQEYQDVYYAEWEQEYPDQGPVFPSPTPYTLVGTNYTLGQRVEVGPLHMLVDARPGAVVERPGVPAGTQQLYYVEITWLNRSGDPISIDYGERVRLRSVTSPANRILTDSIWGMSAESLQIAGMAAPPTSIPPGESRVSIPIIGPLGAPKTVDVVFAMGASAPAPLPTDVGRTPATTFAPTLLTPSATPNIELRATDPQFLTIQWTDTTLRIGPRCDDAGAVTGWGSEPWQEWGHAAAIGMAAPPGAARIIQLALAQVGKPYVWGAKGPEQFDCSGLIAWLYAQIGIHIPVGTAGQWPLLKPIKVADLQPGDLVFIDTENAGRVTHVGILAGDLNGDGQWDMVHAANPALGVRVDYNIFQSSYYAARIVGFRTAR